MPNTNAKSVKLVTLKPQKAQNNFFRAEPGPSWRAYSVPRPPSWWGGACCPSPQAPNLAHGLRASFEPPC